MPCFRIQCVTCKKLDAQDHGTHAEVVEAYVSMGRHHLLGRLREGAPPPVADFVCEPIHGASSQQVKGKGK